VLINNLLPPPIVPVLLDPVPDMAAPKLLPFDGKDDYQGPGLAVAFMNQVDDAMRAGNIADARMSGYAMTAMTGEVAVNWLNLQKVREVAALGLWSTFKPMIRTRWVRALTVLEVRQLMDTLHQRPTEGVQAFRERVEMAHIDEDRTLDAALKAEAGYQTNQDRRMRRMYLAGLRQNIRAAMIGVDPDTATLDAMVALARTAELLSRQAPASLVSVVEAVDGRQEEDDNPVVEAIYQRFQRGGAASSPSGCNPGSSRGGGRKPGRGGGKQSTEKKKEYRGTCNRCGLIDSHGTSDCYVNLEKLERRGKGRFAKGSQRRVNAATPFAADYTEYPEND
jgi:hypothetical protein